MYNVQLIVAVLLLIINLMQICSEINCDVMKLIERPRIVSSNERAVITTVLIGRDP